MGSLALVAEQIERRSTGINSLGLSAALIAWAIPSLAPQAVIYTPGEASLPVEEVNWLNVQLQGWVHVTTDGEGMWEEVERSR